MPQTMRILRTDPRSQSQASPVASQVLCARGKATDLNIDALQSIIILRTDSTCMKTMDCSEDMQRVEERSQTREDNAQKWLLLF